MTPGLRNLLERVGNVHSHGLMLDPSNDRSTAVRLKLIVGKSMNAGHFKSYYLTEAGRRALEKGRLD